MIKSNVLLVAAMFKVLKVHFLINFIQIIVKIAEIFNHRYITVNS